MRVILSRFALASALALAFVPSPLVFAVTTETWTREGRTFLAGSFEQTIATPGGGLIPGPERVELVAPESALIWDALLVDGHTLVAAGESAGVFIIDGPEAKPRPLALAGQGEVFALARGARGAVYAATGPGGAVFRLDLSGGEAEEIFRPTAEYIWDLLALPSGELVVATGLPGRVVKIDPRSKKSVTLWETRDPHVRCLGLRGGKVVAGTAGSGWIVEITAPGEAFVLWDSKRTEVVDLASDGAGTLWAALAGAPGKAESGGTGERPRQEEKKAHAVTTITVRASAGDAGEAKKRSSSRDKSSRRAALPVGGGALLRLDGDGQAREFWSDKKQTPLDLAWLSGRGLLMATASPARIWLIDNQGRDGWWDESPRSRSISALDVSHGKVLAAASNPPALTVYTAERTPLARWTSDILDTKSRSRFGRVHVTTTRAATAAVQLLARSGNTSEPGDAWSPWHEVAGAAGPPGEGGGQLGVPEARFLQLRVEMRGEKAQEILVSGVDAWYRPLNRAPRVDELLIAPPGVAFRALPPPAMTAGDVPVVPVPQAAEVEQAIKGKSRAWRAKKLYEPGALSVSWHASDPDGDALVYSISTCRDRGGRCESWELLAEGLERNFFSFDSRRLEDGVYRFRVTADDTRSNLRGEARQASELSPAVKIDHRAPRITTLKVSRAKQGRNLELTAEDIGGRIAKAEVLTPDGYWVTLAPVDGIADSSRETFRTHVEGAGPITVRVLDAAGHLATRRAE